MRLLLLLLCLALPALAQDEAFELQYVTPDKFLEIYADHPVEKARCETVAARVLKVYAFLEQREGWQNKAPLRAKPLQFRLVQNLKVLGYAKGPNLMVMKDVYLDDPLSEGTLAHELTHIQDFRQLKGVPLPSFLLEGRALTNGQAYRMSLGQEPNRYDRQMAASAVRFTAAQADVLLDDDKGRGWDNQAIGTVLVEFMRTRWNGGVADVHPKLSRMIELMAQGVELEAAFQKVFGASVPVLGEAFDKFLTATQGDANARLQGTMWQGLELAEGTPSDEE